MKQSPTPLWFLTLTTVFASIAIGKTDPLIGKFNPEKDLFLPQFDSKTDVDDIHSVAAVATVLRDPRFEKVNYHAVAGAYGIQEGLYVPANELFELSFGSNWSDAHADFEQALEEVVKLAGAVLKNGGDIWIAEAGQSDFSAATVKRLMEKLPDIDMRKHIHIVQHSDWNESVTAPEKLKFVQEQTDYHKIPDGNAEGNGTPGFRSPKIIDWQSAVKDPVLLEIWTLATTIATRYNGVEDRYLNEAIEAGGLDFSDVAETCWIFGFEELVDANDFFGEFQ